MPQPAGAALTVTGAADVAAGSSVGLPTMSLPVKPGTGYLLTVAIEVPPAQLDTTGASLSEALQIAPGT